MQAHTYLFYKTENSEIVTNSGNVNCGDLKDV